MQRLIITLLILFGLGIINSSPLMAEHPHKGKHGPKKGHKAKYMMSFPEMDANKDGKITLDEFKEAHLKKLSKKFEKMDKNNDGAITKAEYRKNKKAMKKNKAKMRKKWKNKKGTASPTPTPTVSPAPTATP